VLLMLISLAIFLSSSGVNMEKAVIARLAEVVYNLVENADELDLSYDDACDLLGLADYERERVLELIDADLAFV
jgi:hypothetical protein